MHMWEIGNGVETEKETASVNTVQMEYKLSTIIINFANQ